MSIRRRVIVIEDDFLLSETLKEALENLGCCVEAQAANLSAGLQLIASIPCDFAVVDLNLKGEMAFPLLDLLQDRGIPFLLATGSFIIEIPLRHMQATRLPKPYNVRELRNAISLLSIEGLAEQPG